MKVIQEGEDASKALSPSRANTAFYFYLSHWSNSQKLLKQQLDVGDFGIVAQRYNTKV